MSYISYLYDRDKYQVMNGNEKHCGNVKEVAQKVPS